MIFGDRAPASAAHLAAVTAARGAAVTATRGAAVTDRVPPGRTVRAEAGAASLMLPVMLVVATLIAIVAIDIGALLVAAARAQHLADAAALAAVSVDVPGGRGEPAAEARRVAETGSGSLDGCRCSRGVERASVTVSVAIPGLALPRLGATRVVATAEAVLAPGEDLPVGPTRERARWLEPLARPEPDPP